jgi:hypothetical protein
MASLSRLCTRGEVRRCIPGVWLRVALIVGIVCVPPALGDDRRSSPGGHTRWWHGEWKEEFWDGLCEVKLESKRGEFTRQIKCKDGVGPAGAVRGRTSSGMVRAW